MRDLLGYNITALSEESGVAVLPPYLLGELALGLFARSLPPQSRGDHDACNQQWRRVRLMQEAKMLEPQHPKSKSKFRFVG